MVGADLRKDVFIVVAVVCVVSVIKGADMGDPGEDFAEETVDCGDLVVRGDLGLLGRRRRTLRVRFPAGFSDSGGGGGGLACGWLMDGTGSELTFSFGLTRSPSRVFILAMSNGDVGFDRPKEVGPIGPELVPFLTRSSPVSFSFSTSSESVVLSDSLLLPCPWGRAYGGAGLESKRFISKC